MPLELARRIEARFSRQGIAASEGQLAATAEYIGHLAQWNRTINLTALDLAERLDDSLDRLVVEPFLAASAIKSRLEPRGGADALRVLDLGSGGGSPGIPLAIALGTTRLTLVESKARKAAFLRDAIRQLRWTNAAVLERRVEELWSGDFKGSIDVLSIRALAMEPPDWRGAASLLAPAGLVVWFKSATQGGSLFDPLVLEETVTLEAIGSQIALLRLQS